MNVLIEQTHWLSPKALSNQTGIPYRTLWRLIKSGGAWKGWVVSRRKAEMYDNPGSTQEYVWRAMRLGTWNEGCVVGDLKIPAKWFGGLSLIKNGHNALKDLRGVENDLGILRAGEVGALNDERVLAIENIEQGVSILTSEGDFSDLGRVEQILGLFEPFDGKLQVQVEVPETESAEVLVVEKEFPFKRILIAGAKPKPEREQQLKDRFNCELVEWCLVYKESHSAGDRHVKRVLNGQYDAVLLLSNFMGHEHFYKFRNACKESDTPYIQAATLSFGAFESSLLTLEERVTHN